MTFSERTPAERGSTLVVAMILLAVLTAIGVAAVALSSQERRNAGLMTHRDRLLSCAMAAQAAFWNEMAAYGPNFLPSPTATVGEIALSDGTRYTAGHYDQAGMVVVDSTAKVISCRPASSEVYLDLTNRDAGFTMEGMCFGITARCVDPHNRELEVEFQINKLL